MKCDFLSVLLFFILVVPAPQLRAQVSFFQPPTYAGSGTVFVADFNGDGKPDLLCSDGTLNLGNGDGTFGPGTPVSGTPLAVADFNGDGRPDILEQGTGTLVVFLGTGGGTFQSPITTQIAASLVAVAAVDLNGDGKADVVAASGSSLLVYLSKGDGTFAPGVEYSLGAASGTVTLSLGDFNGDNRTDVVVSIDGGGAPGQEVVFLGKGNGTFQAAKASAGVWTPGSAAVGDFNGDGKLDLAVVDTCEVCPNPETVSILLGNGDGTFQTPVVVFRGDDGFLTAADLNGDGKTDLVLLAAQNEVEIYLGNGDGTFARTSSYVLRIPGAGPFDATFVLNIAVADLDADGKLDIAASNGVLLGNGDGTFRGIPLIILSDPPTFPNDIAVVGRFDNARPPEIAVLVNGGVSILVNDGLGTLSLAHTYPLQGSTYFILAGDLNGDGNLDLVVIGSTPLPPPSSVLYYAVLLGNGDGSFRPPTSYPQIGDSSSGGAVVADFNNDKHLDLAIMGFDSYNDSSLYVLLGNGDGTFGVPMQYSFGLPFPFQYSYVGFLQAADFNGDGKLDLCFDVDFNSTWINYGNGDGTFQPAYGPPELSEYWMWGVADFNNDGKPDMLSKQNQIALGNGDGTFTLLPPILPGTSDISPFVGDFNGDGKLDLFVLDGIQVPTMGGILLGNGDGTFGPIVNVLGTGPLPSDFMIVDLKGDGRPDIVFGETLGFGVLFNTTPPGFELSATALSPATITVGDSAISTVRATPMYGFKDAVTLSCGGLPSGASCSFSPPSIANSSGTSPLTITASTSTAPGTYPVQVQGSAGSIAKSLALSLVIQAPDFSMGMASGAPTSQTISAGQTANFNLVITPLESFTGTVNLSCGITPVAAPAPTCTLSSSSVQISGIGAQPALVAIRTIAPGTTATVTYIGFPPGTTPLAWTLILLCSGWLWLRNRKRLPAPAAPLIVLALASWVSCGGGGSSSRHSTPGTPPGTYTATVTASFASVSHSTALQVVVH